MADRAKSGSARVHACPPVPARVRYNEWRTLAPPGGEPSRRGVTARAADAFVPSIGVSVVIAYFEAAETLAPVLAALEGQDWPRDLLEAVVVDDGSRPPLARPDSTLDLRVVRLADRGFGLARARNAGARAAAHDILVFLDADIVAAPGLVAAHARWHHAVADALTLGFCRSVSAAGIDAGDIRSSGPAALFAGRPGDPPWNAHHMAGTGELTARRDDLFRAVTGNNLAISRAFFEEVGGFDETFERYGGEDTEFGYRVQARGGLLVPVRGASAWHLGRWREGRPAKERDAEIQKGKLVNLIPLPGFRDAAPGRSYAVPRHVVTIEAGEAAPECVLEAVEDILADPVGDLVVRVMVPAGFPPAGLAWLESRLAPDPLVKLAPVLPSLDASPAAAVHLVLPAASPRHPGLVGALARALEGRAAVTAVLADGSRATAARGWALHRARRAGGAPGDYGDTATVRMAPPGTGSDRTVRRGLRRMPGRARAAPPETPGGALTRICEEARHVRGARTAWRFLRWFAGALRWRLRQRSGGTRDRSRAPGSVALGVEIAVLGPRARSVFAASPRAMRGLGPSPGDRHVDAALADTPVEAAEAAAAGIPVALLAGDPDRGIPPSLAVPAFDPGRWNPVGWTPNVEDRVGALGPLHLLAPDAAADRRAAPGEPGPLRRFHHVEDTAAFHAGAAARAGILVRLAAAGVPVRLADSDAEQGRELAALLGVQLHALMASGVRGAGLWARESLSIRMRRAALRDHALPARARQVAEAAGLPDPPLPPLVSVLLATRRPHFLTAALANVARQSWPRLELVLALHGAGFAAADPVRRAAGLHMDFPHPVRLLRLDADLPLGAILNAASEAATGTLLAKMDDDDLYGPDHILDLVLAHGYSGSELVGKCPATVYLARPDRTVRCRRSPSETWSRSVTGGTMLIARNDLLRAGGWRRASRHVDRALVDDVLSAGGAVYRTHDEGYVLVRHGEGHTWTVDDGHFLDQAEEMRPGWHPALAGLPADIDAAPLLRALARGDRP